MMTMTEDMLIVDKYYQGYDQKLELTGVIWPCLIKKRFRKSIMTRCDLTSPDILPVLSFTCLSDAMQ